MFSVIRTIGAIAVITAISLTSPAIVCGGKLTAGTKVIYPGGADQPPREKDTGVSLNADAVLSSKGNDNVEFDSGVLTNDSLEKLEAAGDYDLMLQLLANRSDPVAMSYKAIALENTGEREEAESIAIDLIKKKLVGPFLQKKLILHFDLDEFTESDLN